MFVIFNIAAFYVTCLSAVFIIPLALLSKNGIISEDTFLLSSGWILFISDAICRKMNYHGRLFFIIPTWLITLGIAVYGTFYHFGIMVGIIKNVLLITIVFILTFIIFGLFSLYFKEKQKMKDLNYDMDLIIVPNQSNGMLYFWEEIKNLFFFPLFHKYTNEVYAYNIIVFDKLKENNIEIGHSENLYKELKRMRQEVLNGNQGATFNMKVKDTFISEIEHQIEISKVI